MDFFFSRPIYCLTAMAILSFVILAFLASWLTQLPRLETRVVGHIWLQNELVS